ERVKAITGGAGVPFALDAVGGATGSAAVRCLAPGGRMLVYGTLSGEPLVIDPRVLMVGRQTVEGFWLSVWVAQQNPLTMLRLFKSINRLMREGILTSEIAQPFPLEEVRAAVQQAETPSREGKVLLRLGPPGDSGVR